MPGWCAGVRLTWFGGRVSLGRFESGDDDRHQESTDWLRILEPGRLEPERRLGIAQRLQVVCGVPGVCLPVVASVSRSVHVLVEIYQ